jgi:hypothetical protein
MKPKTLIQGLLLLCLLYASVAFVVFRFRHPWATETETIIHPRAVLTYEKVQTSEWRKP